MYAFLSQQVFRRQPQIFPILFSLRSRENSLSGEEPRVASSSTDADDCGGDAMMVRERISISFYG